MFVLSAAHDGSAPTDVGLRLFAARCRPPFREKYRSPPANLFFRLPGFLRRCSRRLRTHEFMGLVHGPLHGV